MSRKVTFQDQLLAATIGPIVAILIVVVSVYRRVDGVEATRRRRREI